MRASFLLPILLAAPLGAQTPEPAPTPSPEPLPPTVTFRSDVELVNVDVVVMDKKGNPVTGLTAVDFVLKDEGKPQTISTFEALTAPPPPPPAPPGPVVLPRVSSNAGARDRKGRTFNIVFDDIHLTAAQALRAKVAVSEFLKTGTRDGDTVTLASTGGGAWWSARMPMGRDELLTMLKRLDGRMIPDIGNDRISDYEAMRIILYSDQQVTDRVTRRFETYGVGMARSGTGGGTDTSRLGGDPLVRGRAQDVYFQSVSRSHITLQLVDRILKSLQTTRGRKSMILVSEGFVYDPSLSEFKDVVDAARRANVAIYFLDTRGLGGLPV
jgi:VWFA-related protein